MSGPWTFPRRVLYAAATFFFHGAVSSAQEAADPLDLVEFAESVCAADPTSLECDVAEARATALLAMAIAEAGNTRDRGFFVEAIRRALTDPSPELRTSAFFALAKLEPDATDTPAILAALFDPVSNVRGGAWAAAGASSDPAIRAVIQRVPVRPPGRGYGADPEPFDPVALGVPIPDGADYLWLTSRLRDEGQVQFLTDAAPAEVLAHFAPLAAGPALPPEAASQAYPEAGFLFGDFVNPPLYGDPQVLVLPAANGVPARMVVVYRDIVFGRTGFAVVQENRAPTVLPPAPVVQEPEPLPEDPIDEAALAAALEKFSGIDPAAPEEETDLYFSILSAYGVGAEDYLELYPEGAYAEAMREIIAGPRLILDALSYPDTGRITVSFRNLPEGAIANIRILRREDDFPLEDNTVLPDAVGGQAVFDLNGQLDPGVHLMVAEVLVDGAEPLVLFHDFSVVAAVVDLALAKTVFAPGEPITVRYAGMSGHAKDYLATAPAGSPGSSYLTYVYTNGQRDGTATLTAPTAPGAYDLRAFFRDDDSAVRASLPFTVSGDGAAPVEVPDAGRTSSDPDPKPEPDPDPVRETKGQTPPEETISLPSASGVTLTLEAAVLPPGGTLTVRFAGMAGAAGDYLATAPAGSPPEAYLAYAYTDGARDGSVTLQAPDREGAYEVRAIFADDLKTVQAARPFAVRADVRLTLDRAVFAPGEAIDVAFSGFSGAAQDYVATAPAGSAASAYVTYAYTNGVREGRLSLQAPDRPGAYELRAFLQFDQGTAKATLPFTVAASP
jgi:hypothetical protein